MQPSAQRLLEEMREYQRLSSDLEERASSLTSEFRSQLEEQQERAEALEEFAMTMKQELCEQGGGADAYELRQQLDNRSIALIECERSEEELRRRASGWEVQFDKAE